MEKIEGKELLAELYLVQKARKGKEYAYALIMKKLYLILQKKKIFGKFQKKQKWKQAYDKWSLLYYYLRKINTWEDK